MIISLPITVSVQRKQCVWRALNGLSDCINATRVWGWSFFNSNESNYIQYKPVIYWTRVRLMKKKLLHKLLRCINGSISNSTPHTKKYFHTLVRNMLTEMGIYLFYFLKVIGTQKNHPSTEIRELSINTLLDNYINNYFKTFCLWHPVFIFTFISSAQIYRTSHLAHFGHKTGQK